MVARPAPTASATMAATKALRERGRRMARRMFDVMFVLSLLTYRSPSTAKESLSSVLVVALGQLDIHARGIRDVRDLETDGRHFPKRNIEMDATRFEALAERFEILDLESDVIDSAAFRPHRRRLRRRKGEVEAGHVCGRLDRPALPLDERERVDVPIEQLQVIRRQEVDVIRRRFDCQRLVFLHLDFQTIRARQIRVRKAFRAGELPCDLVAGGTPRLQHVGDVRPDETSLPAAGNSYSHRKTYDDRVIKMTNITVNTAASPAWRYHPSPCQIPRSSDTADVNGSTRAIICAVGGSASSGTNNPESPIIG